MKTRDPLAAPLGGIWCTNKKSFASTLSRFSKILDKDNLYSIRQEFKDNDDFKNFGLKDLWRICDSLGTFSNSVRIPIVQFSDTESERCNNRFTC